MRGLVFSEFLEFVEDAAGPEMADKMLTSCNLESGGAYTVVGTYDHAELLKMLTFLNEATGQEVSEMVQAFGKHLFPKLAESHPKIVGDTASLFDFLESIETHIHREVRKLYPDAELPAFETKRPSPNHLVMTYSSQRPFADLAFGMISGAAMFFEEKIQIERKDVANGGGYAAEFHVVAA